MSVKEILETVANICHTNECEDCPFQHLGIDERCPFDVGFAKSYPAHWEIGTKTIVTIS